MAAEAHWGGRRGTIVAAAGVLALGLAAATAEAKPSTLTLDTLSSRPDLVTGGDALIAVGVPQGTNPAKVKVRADGVGVTSAFAPSPDDPRRLVGLVSGLRPGANRIAARAPGDRRAAELDLFDTQITGPLFSGPRQAPYYCTTDANDLGPPQDSDCSAPTKVEYRYRSTDGTFKPLADPNERPADLAQTTTRDGRTVDYVVRIESGTINRAVYRWAALAPGGDPVGPWNHRFVYRFGGGCSAGYNQGKSAIGTVLDNRELAEGYAVMSSSLNVFATACNDVLSAETAAMVKEHVIESLGSPPVWTIGQGGSGGSIQVQMTAQNYPGLLDGLLPSASFPDSAITAQPDCRLLQRYFDTPGGSALTPAERQSITGLGNPDGCAALAVGGDVVDATDGCNEGVVPQAVIFDPVTNPTGIRCTIFDSLINVYGTDPATGLARRPLDNVGVQYGLAALRSGDIGLDQFLDLNEGVGGFDRNGLHQAARTVATQSALDVFYRSGRIDSGSGGIPDVPIVDVRKYVDGEVNVHQYANTYMFRARLLRTNGTSANQVMFRAQGGANTKAMEDTALATLSDWLDRIDADTSDRPRSQKVIADRPAVAVDACWTDGGQRTDGIAQIGAQNLCETTYPPHSLPDQRAGKPLDSLVAKCQLEPLDPADYGSPTPAQLARLRAIFPGGVCDYSVPGVGEGPIAGTWQEYGPQRIVQQRVRKLRLKAHAQGRRHAKLRARLRPCPQTTWQRIIFERKRRGEWRAVGARPAEGGRCTAKLRARLRKPAGFRARSKSSPGYAAARSQAARVRPRG